MRYREYAPSKGLADYVRYLWVFERAEEDELFALDRFMPEAGSYLVFQLEGGCRRLDGGRAPCGAAALGSLRQSIDVVFEGATLNVGARFTAAGAAALGVFSPAEVIGLSDFHAPWAESLLAGLLDARSASPGRSGRDAASGADLAALASLLDAALVSRARLREPDPLARFLDRCGACAGYGPGLGCARREGRLAPSCEACADADCPLSRRSLERKARGLTGYSPRELLSLRRCGMARSALYLLDEPDLSDLALSLGYFDLPHFCRSFKRWGGMTPGEYSRFCKPYRRAMKGPDAMIHHVSDSFWLAGGRTR